MPGGPIWRLNVKHAQSGNCLHRRVAIALGVNVSTGFMLPYGIIKSCDFVLARTLQAKA
jgi:hypothetical protein